jgi:hypothetical protein
MGVTISDLPATIAVSLLAEYAPDMTGIERRLERVEMELADANRHLNDLVNALDRVVAAINGR